MLFRRLPVTSTATKIPKEKFCPALSKSAGAVSLVKLTPRTLWIENSYYSVHAWASIMKQSIKINIRNGKGGIGELVD